MSSAIFYPDDGLEELLQATIDYFKTLTLRLYTNDYTPGQGSTPSDFTEATFPGYSGQALSGVSFSVSLASHKASGSSDTVTFTLTGDISPQTVYGWYVKDGGGGGIIAASRAESPVVMEFTDDECRVLLTLTEKDEQTT